MHEGLHTDRYCAKKLANLKSQFFCRMTTKGGTLHPVPRIHILSYSTCTLYIHTHTPSFGLLQTTIIRRPGPAACFFFFEGSRREKIKPLSLYFRTCEARNVFISRPLVKLSGSTLLVLVKLLEILSRSTSTAITSKKNTCHIATTSSFKAKYFKKTWV